MEELGVGRSAVREALLSLQKMGLVSLSSGERARVTAPTATALVQELSGAARHLLAQEGGIRRFQEARMLFEIGLARLAAKQATADDLAGCKDALEANRLAIGDRAAFMRDRCRLSLCHRHDPAEYHLHISLQCCRRMAEGAAR